MVFEGRLLGLLFGCILWSFVCGFLFGEIFCLLSILLSGNVVIGVGVFEIIIGILMYLSIVE